MSKNGNFEEEQKKTAEQAEQNKATEQIESAAAEQGQNTEECEQTAVNSPDAAKKGGVKKTSKSKRVLRGCAIGLALIAMFFGGFFVHKATLPSEINSLLWAKERIQKEYYETIDDEAFFDAVFSGVDSLLDDYSGYMTKEEYEEVQTRAAGVFSGLGIYFSSRDEEGNERMSVSRVAGGSPAEEAEIEEGSRVVAFGLDTDAMTRSDSFSEFSQFLTTVETGETFYLCEQKYPYGEENERVVSVCKRSFVENYVFYRSDIAAYSYSGKDGEERSTGKPLSCLSSDTAYIRLAQFNGNAAAEFDGAMARFKADGKKNLVLDLRDNGGGDLNILCSIASYFCKNSAEKEPIAATAVYKDGDRTNFRAKANRYAEFFSNSSKIYVLADSGTASASECLLGVMLDYGATSYENVCLCKRNNGAKTYGKGIMQTTRTRYPWASEAIKLTTAQIFWPTSGTSIHGRGVLPQDGALQTQEIVYGDAEIRAAIAILLG